MRLLTLVLICITLFLATFRLVAQESTPESTADPMTQGWSIIEHCVTESLYVRTGETWPFEGVIFTTSSTGVRALRADVGVPYFVGFSNARQFSEAGAVSPDGTMFAVPVGEVEFYANSVGDSLYYFEGFNIYSTDVRHELLHSISWNEYMLFFTLGDARSYPLFWYDNVTIINGWREEGGGVWTENNNYYSQINIQTGEVTSFDEPFSHDNISLSPDKTRLLVLKFAENGEDYWELYDTQSNQLLNSIFPATPTTPLDKNLLWLPNSSGFWGITQIPGYTHSSTASRIVQFDRDGNLTETIMTLPNPTNPIRSFATSPQNTSQVAFLLKENDWHEYWLYIADTTRKTIWNTCLKAYSVVWSPDGQYLAFSSNRNISIFDLSQNRIDILPFNVGEALGWYELNQ